VATATLAALVGGGTLGRFIADGFALRDTPQLIGGAILVALLAVVTERFDDAAGAAGDFRPALRGTHGGADAGGPRAATVAAGPPW